MPRPPRLAVYAGGACALAAVAAVVSFVRGDRVGIVWVLLAGLASNMAWYYARRGGGIRGARAGRGGAPAGCGSGGACGGCVPAASKEQGRRPPGAAGRCG